MLQRFIKDDWNNFLDSCFPVERLNTVRMPVFVKLIYEFSGNPVEVTSCICFFRIQQMILTILRKILKTKSNRMSLTLTDIKIYCKATITKTFQYNPQID